MASTAFFIFSFLCLACVVVLVWACRDSKANWPLKAASKTAAALCFIGAAAAQYIRVPTANQNERTYGFWIIVALVFSLGGDVALLFDDKQAFLAGLASFLLAHVCYIVAFSRSYRFDASAAVGHASWIVSFLVGVGWMLLFSVGRTPNQPKEPAVTGSMRGPVIAYLAVIAAMTLAAFSLKKRPTSWIYVGTGAALFALSDVFVANRQFGVIPSGIGQYYNEVLGLPLYFIAQLLMARSIDGSADEKPKGE